MGKKVCLLSNAPSRNDYLRAHLDELGVHDYDLLLSSGELAWHGLRYGDPPEFASLGRNCLMIGHVRFESNLVAGLDLEFCQTPEKADFVWAVGVPENEAAILREMRERGLPLLCGNPDLEVRFGDKILRCAGSFARHYQQMGGRVIYCGKPNINAYRRCLEFCGSRHVAAIGDGMPTDITGACRAGLDSYFIASGIHAEKIGFSSDCDLASLNLEAFFAEFGCQPSASMPYLRW
jgi:HAD superfamily hydrolase (TIGR01459 family)